MRIIFGSYPVNQVCAIYSEATVTTPTKKKTVLKLVVYVDGKKIAES